MCPDNTNGNTGEKTGTNHISFTSGFVVVDETACSAADSINTEKQLHADISLKHQNVIYSDIEETFQVEQELCSAYCNSNGWNSVPMHGKTKPQNTLEKQMPGNKHAVIAGSGSYANVKAANMKFGRIRQQFVKPGNNQMITGVFVTRLAPNTTARQLALHIRKEIGYQIKPERMPVKRDDLYSSWFIPADNRRRQELLC